MTVDGRALRPGRVSVFGEVWLWSTVLTVVGGAVIGAVGFPLSVFIGSWPPEDVGTVVLTIWIGLIGGLVCGLLLGPPAGVVLGLFVALVLVPYRGAAITTLMVRAVATLLVVVPFVLVLGSHLWEGPRGSGFWLMVVPSVLGAWWISPLATRSYIARMSDG